MRGVCDDKATSFEHHDTTAMEMYASVGRLLFFWTAGSILKGNVSPILFCFLQSNCVTGGNQVIVWKTWHALVLQLRLVHFSVLYFKARVLVFLFEMTTSCFKKSNCLLVYAFRELSLKWNSSETWSSLVVIFITVTSWKNLEKKNLHASCKRFHIHSHLPYCFCCSVKPWSNLTSRGT